LDAIDPSDPDMIIIEGNGTFADGAEHTFRALLVEEEAIDSWDTGIPADGSPFLTLDIQFDDYPVEIGWTLSNVGQARNTVAFRQPKYYNTTVDRRY